MPKSHSDIGLIGLAVMGQNLALNIADHGFQISVYNRTTEKTDKFVAENPNTPGGLKGTKTLEEFVQSLAKPRKMIILVQAGKANDAVIDGLVPLLEQGDIVIDGGNALWTDTIRREKALAAKGLRFIGSGVSGGEEGARFGPSLMPGGEFAAWKELKPIWEAVAAKVDAKTGRPLTGATPGKPVVGGVPCTTYIGENGAGHYVKMIHNGIEYGDMQLICEAYALFKAAGFTTDEMAAVFNQWNEGDLQSYLIQITGKALEQKDPETGKPLVDVILDKAGQKGTGQWTLINAAEQAVVISTINAAVEARVLSSQKKQRVAASSVLQGPTPALSLEKKALVDKVHDALYASKVISYTQGFDLIKTMGEKRQWGLDLGGIASIWRGGCIIRARFLNRITEAYERDSGLALLLADEYFVETVGKGVGAWRRTVSQAALNGVPTPAFSSSLAYYDGVRAPRLPANLIQAQRDFFGAHTYRRTDRGGTFHTEWSGDRTESPA